MLDNLSWFQKTPLVIDEMDNQELFHDSVQQWESSSHQVFIAVLLISLNVPPVPSGPAPILCSALCYNKML